MWRELSALYRSFLSGEPVVLPACRSRTGITRPGSSRGSRRPALTKISPSGRRRCAGLPHCSNYQRTGRVRQSCLTGEAASAGSSADLTEALRNTSRQEKTSLFTIFAAALNTLLYRYSGCDDILLGIPLADRDQQELQSVVGFLLHTHVLRTRLSGDMTFRDLLGRVQKAVLDLYTHRSAPFDQIVRKLQPERNLSYTPLFQVMLNWRDRDQQLSFIGLEGLAIESLMAAANTSKFDLFLFVTDTRRRDLAGIGIQHRPV